MVKVWLFYVFQGIEDSLRDWIKPIFADEHCLLLYLILFYIFEVFSLLDLDLDWLDGIQLLQKLLESIFCIDVIQSKVRGAMVEENRLVLPWSSCGDSASYFLALVEEGYLCCGVHFGKMVSDGKGSNASADDGDFGGNHGFDSMEWVLGKIPNFKIIELWLI